MIKVKIPNNFMIPVELLRFSKGEYVNGDWVESEPKSVNILASIQPVPSSEYRLLPEGDSPSKYRQIYTNSVLSMPSKDIKPDEIIDKGITYRLSGLDDWTLNGHTSGLFKEVEK